MKETVRQNIRNVSNHVVTGRETNVYCPYVIYAAFRLPYSIMDTYIYSIRHIAVSRRRKEEKKKAVWQAFP